MQGDERSSQSFHDTSVDDSLLPFNLNESQTEAILSCLSARACGRKHSFKLIWGPPGTGKTKTVSILLCFLLNLKCRTLTCAPTNTAVVQVVSRLLALIKEDSLTSNLALGDIVLFGSKDRLKVDGSLRHVFLDYRVKRLLNCFAQTTGWKHCLNAVMDFFENCLSQYHDCSENKPTLTVFLQRRFRAVADKLVPCIKTLCQDLPRASISEEGLRNLVMLQNLLRSFGDQMCTIATDREVRAIFLRVEQFGDLTLELSSTVLLLRQIRSQCLNITRTLLETLKLPLTSSKDTIQDFCLINASLVFCTASSSSKLHVVPNMRQFEFLVVDEAAQLKECESLIPLMLSGLRHAVLIGDECQLPAMVRSKVRKNHLFFFAFFFSIFVLFLAKVDEPSRIIKVFPENTLNF